VRTGIQVESRRAITSIRIGPESGSAAGTLAGCGATTVWTAWLPASIFAGRTTARPMVRAVKATAKAPNAAGRDDGL
jgi:hypothetical protein